MERQLKVENPKLDDDLKRNLAKLGARHIASRPKIEPCRESLKHGRIQDTKKAATLARASGLLKFITSGGHRVPTLYRSTILTKLDEKGNGRK